MVLLPQVIFDVSPLISERRHDASLAFAGRSRPQSNGAAESTRWFHTHEYSPRNTKVVKVLSILAPSSSPSIRDICDPSVGWRRLRDDAGDRLISKGRQI